MLLTGCLDPCLQENDGIKNSFVFSSRCVPFLGSHRQLETHCVLLMASTASLHSCVCVRALFSLTFFPCTHELQGPCVRPVVSCAGLCSKLKKHIWELLVLQKLECPPSLLLLKEFHAEGRKSKEQAVLT